MPLTAKGEKILAAMQEKYGDEEGKRIFYASKNAGTIEGVDAVRKTTVRNKRGELIATAEEREEEDAIYTMEDAMEMDLDDAAQATTMEGGYLRAMPRIARTGIQIYRGSECGRDSMEKVRVYRPPSSVFAPDAVKSYTHLPVTIEHPGVPVDARNWRKHAVGETGDDVLRDGEMVRVPMMLRDSAAITALKAGKNQISVGYSCDLDWEDGITPEGDKYDAVQRNIRGNHVAIVSTARGGPDLKFGDEGDEAMDLKTLTIDGIPCQMTDTAVAVVQKLIDQNNNFAERFKKKKKGEEEAEEEDGLKQTIAAKDAAIAVKDKELADLQAKLKDATAPATIDAAVKARSAVIDKAVKIAGKQFKTDGVSDADIKRQIVNGKLGDVAKGYDDNQVSAAFDAITIGIKSDSIKDAVVVFGQPGRGYHESGSMDPRDQAYYDSVKELENAWRKPATT